MSEQPAAAGAAARAAADRPPTRPAGLATQVTVVSWVLRDYGGAALDFGPAAGCLARGDCGDLAVLRLSLGSVLFFAAMTLASLGVTQGDNPRLGLHLGFWPLK
jgi:hypothetical protein